MQIHFSYAFVGFTTISNHLQCMVKDYCNKERYSLRSALTRVEVKTGRGKSLPGGPLFYFRREPCNKQYSSQ